MPPRSAFWCLRGVAGCYFHSESAHATRGRLPPAPPIIREMASSACHRQGDGNGVVSWHCRGRPRPRSFVGDSSGRHDGVAGCYFHSNRSCRLHHQSWRRLLALSRPTTKVSSSGTPQDDMTGWPGGNRSAGCHRHHQSWKWGCLLAGRPRPRSLGARDDIVRWPGAIFIAMVLGRDLPTHGH